MANHQFNGFRVGIQNIPIYTCGRERYQLFRFLPGQTCVDFKIVLAVDHTSHSFNIWLQGAPIIQEFVVFPGQPVSLDRGTVERNKLCFMLEGGAEYQQAGGDIPEEQKGLLYIEATPKLQTYTALRPKLTYYDDNKWGNKGSTLIDTQYSTTRSSYSPSKSGVAGLSPEESTQQFMGVNFEGDASKMQKGYIRLIHWDPDTLIIPRPLKSYEIDPSRVQFG